MGILKVNNNKKNTTMDIQKENKKVQDAHKMHIFNSFSNKNEILGNDDEIQKGHNEGDIHPNGKLVWRKTPSGYDWRNIKKEKKQESKIAPKKENNTLKSSGLQFYGSNPKLDKIIDHGNVLERIEVAKQGYGLDVLVNDSEWRVRSKVAQQGYGLEKLVNDKDNIVRRKAQEMIDKKNKEAVVKKQEEEYNAKFPKYGTNQILDNLINDNNQNVRIAVARQGYGLDKLLKDPEEMVRDAAKEYLRKHSEKSEESKIEKTIEKEAQEHSKTYNSLKQDAKDGKLNISKKEFAKKINEDHKKSSHEDFLSEKGKRISHEDFLSEKGESYVESENYPSSVLKEMNKRDSTFFVGKRGNVYKIYSSDNKFITNIAVKKENMTLEKAETLLFSDKKESSVKEKKSKREIEIEKAENLLFSEDALEKAHNEGDIHPNGKLVWRKTPSGYDWRNIKKEKVTATKEEPKKEVIYKNPESKNTGKFPKYGSNKSMDKLVNDEDWEVRMEVARQGYGLDKLVNDEDWEVRKEIARQGYGLDKLVNDKNWEVRMEVVRQGYGLDKLIKDEDKYVRMEVASQGYGLDKLVNDKNCVVRKEIARQGYGLDKLVNDEDWEVRMEVARQGYGLDKLIKDEDKYVRKTAKQKLQEQIESKKIRRT